MMQTHSEALSYSQGAARCCLLLPGQQLKYQVEFFVFHECVINMIYQYYVIVKNSSSNILVIRNGTNECDQYEVYLYNLIKITHSACLICDNSLRKSSARVFSITLGGGELQYLGIIGRCHGDDAYFMPHQDLINPLFLLQKMFVSITFSSRNTWT